MKLGKQKWVSVCATLAIGMPLILSPVLAQRNLTPSKTSESDSQADKLVGSLTYEQAIERYGLPQAEKYLASGRIVSQWEKRQGISGQGQSGYGSGGGWQHISGGETLVMVCTFNEKGVLEKQTFNFGRSLIEIRPRESIFRLE